MVQDGAGVVGNFPEVSLWSFGLGSCEWRNIATMALCAISYFSFPVFPLLAIASASAGFRFAQLVSYILLLVSCISKNEGGEMPEDKLRRIGILTGGGDCPGLNAVIRSVAKTAMNDYSATVIGIEDGFEGFVEGRMRELTNPDVSGILALGGTILGTSNKGDPFHYPMEGPDGKLMITDASAGAEAL